MDRWLRAAVQLALIGACLIAWEAASRSGAADPRLLPPPTVVAPRVVALLGDPGVLWHLWITTLQVVVAFAVAAPLGIGIGLLLRESDYLGEAFKPFFYFIASVPKSVFLPIFILVFGIGFAQKVAFGVFQAIFVLVISAIAAASSVPPALIQVARANGATRAQIYAQIYWPAMLPLIVEGMRLGMIFSITGVIFAEMYVSRGGLGFLIAGWGQVFDLPSLFAGIVIAAGLSIVVNEALRAYEHRVGRWRV